MSNTSSPICAGISGELSGSTFQGALTNVALALALAAQTAHIQLSAKVGIGGANTKTIAVPQGLGNVGDIQNLFLLKVDQPVTVELNGDAALTFTLTKPGAFLLFVGGPVVTSILLTNAGSATATAHLTTIYGPA